MQIDLWLAGHECVIDHVASTSAFKLTAQLQGIDSNVAQAWGGTVGVAYGTASITWDDFGGVVSAARFDCSTIEAVPGCEVAVGELCLQCVDAGGGVQLCP